MDPIRVDTFFCGRWLLTGSAAAMVDSLNMDANLGSAGMRIGRESSNGGRGFTCGGGGFFNGGGACRQG